MSAAADRQCETKTSRSPDRVVVSLQLNKLLHHRVTPSLVHTARPHTVCVPVSSTCPFFTNAIVLACFTVLRRWAITIRVTPAELRAYSSIDACKIRSDCVSSAVSDQQQCSQYTLLTSCRLVKQQDLRLAHKRSCNTDAHSATARVSNDHSKSTVQTADRQTADCQSRPRACRIPEGTS